jgi:predicted dehydrogenase
MARQYRLGVIGFGHMHVNSLMDEFAKLPNVQWVACADTVPLTPSLCAKESTRRANLARARERIGVPEVFEDYREMLRRRSFDLVIFCPENARHAEVAEEIARSGAHMLTEKPMAASLSEALRMARAAREAGVTLAVNWPTTWSGAVRAAKRLIDEGAIGEAWELKWRNGASMGPLAYGVGANLVTEAEKGAEWWHQARAGGGALLDYCCYGACLARWYFGEPAVSALGLKVNISSHYGDAEDNAVITVRFPRSIAVLEGTWTTWHTGLPIGPVVYGSRGTLVVDNATDPSTLKPAQAVKVYSTRGYAGEPDRVVFGEPLPAGRATIAEELLHHIESGEPLHPTLEVGHNLGAMAILDAGIRSATSGKLELIGDAAWCIG